MNLNKNSPEEKSGVKEEKKEMKSFSLDEIIAKESVKTSFKNDVFEKSIDLQNGSEIKYRFKPIDIDDYLEASADGTSEELTITTLSKSLINADDEFYTREQVIKGIPKQWRLLIMGDVLTESGITIDPEVMGF